METHGVKSKRLICETGQTSKGNKREDESFTNAKMRKEYLDPQLNQERGKLTYDPGNAETFNATFFLIITIILSSK